MLKSDAIRRFGSASALARALNIKPPSIYGWPDTVPPLRQLQLEALTDGALAADPALKIEKKPPALPTATGENQ